jgi:hypothetical protein
MTNTQERAIALALNVLYVQFFECPDRHYETFITNDEWALLMTTAAEVTATTTPAPVLALAVLRRALAREGFFEGMTDFRPPAHYCSFLRNQVQRGERRLSLQQCVEGQQRCPNATFENIKASR